ncbi:MAG: hypothetical protein ACTHLO_02660 [Pseudolabrys sp.]
MIRVVFVGVCMLIAVAVAAPAAAQQSKPGRTSENTAAKAADDCEVRMQMLDASDAEGEERLAVKNEVIAFCARQYARDTTIKKLVSECAKYEEQPVLKQQFVAECQLAAFAYANALRTLKMEYGK